MDFYVVAAVAQPAGPRAKDGHIRGHAKLGADWHFAPENPAFREKVLETLAAPDGTVACEWVPRRALPQTDAWFETAWAAYREGRIYG